ncbi:hypothetical protein E2C01_002404 [Portunus trituberculatus]|uniref:Uncharacterized protein n=1 Tax=Portunus trituberculatus TaxID=210409 RepID=A0A5B7CN61_PORTR|nr:hypothetical protein [Portunus trituberculatus]
MTSLASPSPCPSFLPPAQGVGKTMLIKRTAALGSLCGRISSGIHSSDPGKLPSMPCSARYHDEF